MRCATPVNLVTFAGTSGDARVTTQVLSVGPEGAVCATGQYVVLSRSEFDNATASPFVMSLAEGGAIASAVILVWAFAFGIRALIQLLRINPAPVNHDD
jgi:hypothetical protein